MVHRQLSARLRQVFLGLAEQLARLGPAHRGQHLIERLAIGGSDGLAVLHRVEQPHVHAQAAQQVVGIPGEPRGGEDQQGIGRRLLPASFRNTPSAPAGAFGLAPLRHAAGTFSV